MELGGFVGAVHGDDCGLPFEWLGNWIERRGGEVGRRVFGEEFVHLIDVNV